MAGRAYVLLSATLFLLVSLLHLARLLWQVPVEFGSFVVPFWVSWGGFLGAAALSIWGYRVARR
jgi:hypothetical protein